MINSLFCQVSVQGGNPKTAGDPSGAVGPTLLTILIMIVIVICAGFGIMWYRRRVLNNDSTNSDTSIIEQFRRMRESGEISEEEFEATRRAMAQRLSGQIRASALQSEANQSMKNSTALSAKRLPANRIRQNPPVQPPDVRLDSDRPESGQNS